MQGGPPRKEVLIQFNLGYSNIEHVKVYIVVDATAYLKTKRIKTNYLSSFVLRNNWCIILFSFVCPWVETSLYLGQISDIWFLFIPE